MYDFPMRLRPEQLDHRLAELDRLLENLRPQLRGGAAEAIDRFRADAGALRFHLEPKRDHRPVVAVLGGTGTGKSTLVNRLVEANLSGTSFRRTFTSGALAIAAEPGALPENWLGLEHQPAGQESLPAQGAVGSLTVVRAEHALTSAISLVDTPDLDGDQPLHHAEADRAFRWAEAVVFLVTPEKYQMNELLPYYRLARRYAIPALFVMNKCEEQAVLADFIKQLASRDYAEPAVFAIPRDGAAYEAPPGMDLAALRSALCALTQTEIARRKAELAGASSALTHRAADMLDRLRDQVIGALRHQRRQIDQVLPALRALETPTPGVDVSPVTQQLRRRLQEQSVLYLMGPERMLQRVRQVPGALLRLPRTMWDVVMGAGGPRASLPDHPAQTQAVPDFRAILIDQFTIAQSRMEDLLRAGVSGQNGLVSTNGDSYALVKISPAEAGRIAQEELADLKHWLDERWTRPPRDTMVLQKLLRVLPGGRKLTSWSEAAPYLLAIIVATHGALFAPIHLVIIGGFTIGTWVGEKLSNEVGGRTRQTNRRMAQRFDKLAREQIERLCRWLDQQAPPTSAIDKLERAANEISEGVE